MKLICFLFFVVIAPAFAGPVCGQPPMPPCPPGLACIQMMPAPKTYSSHSEMKQAKAEFISDGPCEGRFVPCKPWEHQTKKGVCIACGDEEPWDVVKEKCGPNLSVQIANPASVNCGKLGGKSEIITTKSGQYSNCAIEKTILFRAMKARGLIKDSQQIADQASANCIAINGTLKLENCLIEEWSLMKVIDVISGNPN